MAVKAAEKAISPTDTFKIYYGGLLVNPAPVELSFNWCSHACTYCFANLNKPGRKANINATLNRLQKMHKGNARESALLREGYPVLVSNRVDPFAVSNYRQSLPVMRLMTELGIPISFQTKGGRGIDEALEFLPSSCWYISIATLDDDHRAKVEPGAPSISDRLALIEKLVAHGHHVSIGINPTVPEWLPDPLKLTKEIAARGAYGAWIAPLHFNHRQLKTMGPDGQALLGETVIKRAKQRRHTGEDSDFLDQVEDAVGEAGLAFFCGDHPKRSNYWDPYKETYKKQFPLFQDFINHLLDSGIPDRSLVTIDQFLDFFTPKFPAGRLRIGEHIGAMAKSVKGPNWSDWMTYRELLTLLWGDGRIAMSPVRNRAFSFASDRGFDGKLVDRFDDNGYPILIFSTSGFNDYHIEV